MSTWYGMTYPESKEEMYELLAQQLTGLMEGEREWLPNLANASALINRALKDINWAGFYLMKDGMLVLGPFQGKPACIEIPIGKGVCGAAAMNKKTMLVPNVHLFEGHIACDGASNSEIVIPLLVKNEVIGVLDVDSPVFDRFTEADRDGLEEFARILSSTLEMQGRITL